MSHGDTSPKRYAWVILGCLTVFISGCSARAGLQTISFDGYSISISEKYTPVPVTLVENKQIINKVIKSYKIPTDGLFDENLIITSSVLAPDLDYEQFRTVNTGKLRDQVAGYTPGTKKIKSFTCNGKSIEGILVSFEIKDTLISGIDTYYIHQYQFVHNEKGYIISAAGIEPNQEKSFEKRINSLTCLE